jgi:hypothetical protein
LEAANREQNITQVMRWIIQSNLQVTTVSNSNHDFVIQFSETATLPDIQIVHQKLDSAFVLIVGQVKIPQSDREKLKNLKREKFSDFIWSLKLNLLNIGVDFTVLGSERDPDSWEIQKRLFLNDTNTSQFYEAYSKVKYALIGIIWSYKRELDLKG